MFILISFLCFFISWFVFVPVSVPALFFLCPICLCTSFSIAYFGNSATAGPQPRMKKEEGINTKSMLENLKKSVFHNLLYKVLQLLQASTFMNLFLKHLRLKTLVRSSSAYELVMNLFFSEKNQSLIHSLNQRISEQNMTQTNSESVLEGFWKISWFSTELLQKLGTCDFLNILTMYSWSNRVTFSWLLLGTFGSPKHKLL